MTTDTITADWPAEMAYAPTTEQLQQERQYWADLDRIAEYDAYLAMQAEEPDLDDFSTCPLDDLLIELQTVRTLTPDQEEVIAELEAAIEQLSGEAAA
jgi:hypothetical protein